MKRLIRALPVLFLLGFTSNALAQTTINLDDIVFPYLNNINPKVAADSNFTVDMGAPGGNNTWDFSQIEEQYVFNYELLEPGTTPYADSFSQATVVTYFSFMDTTFGIDAQTWGYNLISDGSGDLEEGLYSLGGATETETEEGDILTFFRIEPEELIYKTPLNYEDQWVTEVTSFITTSAGDFALTNETQSTTTNTVDAWGTMILPGGETVDALRIKEMDVQEISSFPGLPPTTITTYTYIFVGKNGETVSTGKDDGTEADTGMVTGFASYFNFEGNQSGTNIEEAGLVDAGFVLEQNFPNPFTTESTFTFTLDAAGPVVLSIYDLLGREVETLIDGFKSAGKHSVSFNSEGLSGGVYLYKMSTPDGTQVRSMSVIR